jgi:hypothetical protein
VVHGVVQLAKCLCARVHLWAVASRLSLWLWSSRGTGRVLDIHTGSGISFSLSWLLQSRHQDQTTNLCTPS